MLTILAKFKGYLYAIGGVAIAALAALARILYLKNQRDNLKHKAEAYKAQAHRQRVIAEADNEIEEQTRSRRTDALKELEDTGDSDAFRNPAGLWHDRRKD